MIKSLTIKGFKSLEKITLNLSNLNLFVGTNASGKSNFFDGLRVLQGIGYGFTIDEIFNGKPKSATSEVWDAIRGGSSKATFTPRGHSPSPEKTIQFSLAIQSPDRPGIEFQYSIGILPERGCVCSEKLQLNGSPIFDSEPIINNPDSSFIEVRYYQGNRGRQPHLKFEKSSSVKFLRY